MYIALLSQKTLPGLFESIEVFIHAYNSNRDETHRIGLSCFAIIDKDGNLAQSSDNYKSQTLYKSNNNKWSKIVTVLSLSFLCIMVGEPLIQNDFLLTLRSLHRLIPSQMRILLGKTLKLCTVPRVCD